MSDHAQNDGIASSSTTAEQQQHHRRFPLYEHNKNKHDFVDEEEDNNDSYSSTPLTYRNLAQHLTRRNTAHARIEMPVKPSAYVCGLLAGVVQAGLFNPYDRALYLSVKENRSFLALQNWQSPYNGFFQSLGGRALSGGLYFPLEHYFLQLIPGYTYSRSFDKNKNNNKADDGNDASVITSPAHSWHHFMAGTAAGAANACVLNPLSAVKYKSWGRQQNRGMWNEAVGMVYKAGGLRPFWNGLLPTIYRDVVFGGCYTFFRFRIQKLGQLEQWQANCLAAALATIASGPFNYVRNIQYGTKSREKAMSTWSILADLWYAAAPQENLQRRLYFLLTQLRIGWGTARVSLGISLGHAIYDWLQDNLWNLSHLLQ